MRVDLPSGGYVEYRDTLRARDKFAVQEAIKFRVSEDEGQEVSGGIANDMRNALLCQVVTAWSLGPLPSADLKAAMAAIDDLDIDDYNAIQEAVEPLLAKVGFRPNRKTPSGSAASS